MEISNYSIGGVSRLVNMMECSKYLRSYTAAGTIFATALMGG